MAKHYYFIESLAPLVFRSGKPFGAQAYQDDATFPLPSSAAGLIRALKLEQNQNGFKGNNEQRATLADDQVKELRDIACAGALLAKQDENHHITLLVPKPSDAVFFKNKDTQATELIRLIPKQFDQDCDSDLHQKLIPVQMEQDHIKGKPESGIKYWSLDDLIKWQDDNALDIRDIQKNGLKNIPVDIRTHVALNNDSLASDDGYLFQTAGLDLGHQKITTEPNTIWSNSRLVFVVGAECELQQGLATFGGERRLSHFKKVEHAIFPDMDVNLHQNVQLQKGFKLTLLTPSIFQKGYLPAWLDQETLTGTLPNSPHIQVALKAVAVDRWLPVSGWDLQQWKPKAMRKAVAAGSVYWFEILSGTMTQQDIDHFWFKNLTDDLQDQKDGFGLTMITAWSAQ